MGRFVFAVDNSQRVEEGDALVGFITVEADSVEKASALLWANGTWKADEFVHVGEEVDADEDEG